MLGGILVVNIVGVLYYPTFLKESIRNENEGDVDSVVGGGDDDGDGLLRDEVCRVEMLYEGRMTPIGRSECLSFDEDRRHNRHLSHRP